MQMQIEGYPNYTIDELGNVFSIKSGRVLRGSTTKFGYKSVELFSAPNKSKRFLVHRLVAEAFIPNPNGFPIINHKDENPSNNAASNLEWCTSKHNVNYGTAQKRKAEKLEPFYRSERIKETARQNGKAVSIPVVQLSKDGEYIRHYSSGKDAAIKTGINHSHILEVCAGKRKSAGGFRWQYKERK